MSGALIKISPRDLPVPKIKTEPAWKKPVIDYPKDATIIEIPYKWDRKPAKQGKKEKQKPKPITIRKQKQTWTQEEVDTLLTMKDQGHSLEKISKALGKSYASVWSKNRKIEDKKECKKR